MQRIRKELEKVMKWHFALILAIIFYYVFDEIYWSSPLDSGAEAFAAVMLLLMTPVILVAFIVVTVLLFKLKNIIELAEENENVKTIEEDISQVR